MNNNVQIKKFLISIKPIYYVSKLLGVVPITISGDKLITINCASTVYTVIVLVFILTCSIISVQQRVGAAGVKVTIVVTECFMVIVATLKSIVAILKCLSTNRHMIKKLLEKILTIDKYILFDFNASYRRMFKFMSIHVLVTFFFTIMLFVYDTSVWSGEVGLLYILPSYPVRIINLCTILQFCDLVLLTRNRISIVNIMLENLLKEVEANNMELKLLNISGIKIKRVFPPVEISDMVLNPSINIRISKQGRIHELRQIWDEICDIVRIINAAYGLLILLDIAIGTIELLLSSYLVLAALLKLDDINIEQFVSLQTGWLIFYFFKLISVTAPCQSASNEEGNTEILIQKLLLSKNIDSLTQLELRLFSQQIFQQKIKFTASGFLNIDYYLLLTIIGGVTTYLIIAVQYK